MQTQQTITFANPHKDAQASPIIMDALTAKPFMVPDTTTELKMRELLSFAKTLELLGALGWEEHTGDWDPYLVITTKNGSYTTESGYYNFDQLNETTIIFDDADEDGEQKPQCIPVNDIISIQLYR